jgi:hypothetical protein
MNLLGEVLYSFQELESPVNFWYWSTLAAISAIVKDNVYLDRGGAFKTYPNIYVMLLANSGMKKGPPVAFAKRLVQSVNSTKIISGRSSIQGIMKELGTAVSQPGGHVNKKATAFIVASEFTSSLVNDPAALTILTDLYDRNWNPGEYASLLKMESYKIQAPTISLLVATNKAHFDDFVTNKDFKGGFIGRMFVIAEKNVNKLNPLIRPMINKPNEEGWVNYLKEVSQLQGEFRPIADTEAGDIFEKWYHDFYGRVNLDKVEDETGTIQRYGDSVLKVAMLISLSKRKDLVIDKEDMEEAIKRCGLFIGSVRQATFGKSGKSSMADQKTLIIKELLDRPNNQISRAILLSKYWMHFEGHELDTMIQSMEQAGLIMSGSVGNQIIYGLKPEEVEALRKYFKGE